MNLDYSYTVIDPQTRCARTFTVTTDSRVVATQAIRSCVQQINRKRLADGCERLIPCPSREQLDACEPRPRMGRTAGRVSFFA